MKNETEEKTRASANWFKRLVSSLWRFKHEKLGWHNNKGREGFFDGATLHAKCSCGKEVMQDSQGNWFEC